MSFIPFSAIHKVELINDKWMAINFHLKSEVTETMYLLNVATSSEELEIVNTINKSI